MPFDGEQHEEILAKLLHMFSPPATRCHPVMKWKKAEDLFGHIYPRRKVCEEATCS